MSDITPENDADEATVDAAKSAPDDRETAGPFDESEANSVRPYVDLGGVKILPRPELGLRLEIEEGSKRVVAVALDYAEYRALRTEIEGPKDGPHGCWGPLAPIARRS